MSFNTRTFKQFIIPDYANGYFDVCDRYKWRGTGGWQLFYDITVRFYVISIIFIYVNDTTTAIYIVLMFCDSSHNMCISIEGEEDNERKTNFANILLTI